LNRIEQKFTLINTTLKKLFDTIILEGGSLKCSFTAGILDILLDFGYPTFDNYFGVSSGSMAMSYFISRQKKHFINVARAVVEDSNFLSYTNTFAEQGLMNLEFLEKYVATTFPFDEKAADKYSAGKNVRIITTDYTTGEPHYLKPNEGKWLNYMMASGTLPLITKGRNLVDGKWMFDGGYSDPIPVKEAIRQGSKNLLVIRTRPAEIKIQQSYVSMLAEYWNYDRPAIARLFKESYDIYNDTVAFLNGPKPEGINWHVIAPYNELKSDGYYLHKEDIDADYRLGLEKGLEFIDEFLQ
jgi:predicted patatin/cPLA2 family phospholipase